MNKFHVVNEIFKGTNLQMYVLSSEIIRRLFIYNRYL